MKRIVLKIILCLLLIPAISSGEDLYEEQLNKGIRNSEPYTYLLIRQSEENKAKEISILMEALKYSPDLPSAYFELSKARVGFSPNGTFKAIDYLVKGITAYKRNFWWSFTMAGSLLISALLSFIISIVAIILLRLPVDLPLLSHDIKEEKSRVLCLLVLLSSIIGPLFFIGSILIIIGLYMKRLDKAVVYIYLLVLLVSPWILNTASMFFSAPASGELKAIVQVNESKGNKYALSILRGRNNPVALFTYALAMKREGGYSEAINIYNQLIARSPSAELYNNLANCYFGINDIEKAEELYKKSIQIQPLPIAYYNLSELFRGALNYEKGDEYYLAAQRLDSDAVSKFRTIFGNNPNRFVIDKVLSGPDFWEYARNKTTSVSALDLSIFPQALMPIVAFLIGIVFYVFNMLFKTKAYRCKRCGTILCHKCEKRILWGRMCLQCYRSLVKLDELDAKERIARVQTIYEHEKKRRDIIKIITFIMPGSGQIFAGNILYGMFFLWAFLFFLFIPITNYIFVPETSYFSHRWLSWWSLVIMFGIYFISYILTKRRLAKGWL
ncbi:MAG: hypothetical protein A2Y97_10215 [Nitrospirae bacterium RBG_13_39_12]|nr:MAG: hypothetical protein A2Y97_10215 [Nitrospirae bacterium RBG_13_39_12]